MPKPGKPHRSAGKSVRSSVRPYWRLTAALAGVSIAVWACSMPDSKPVSTTTTTPAPVAKPAGPALDFAEFQKTVQPFLEAHCYDCHGETDAEANVRLDQFTDAASLAKGVPTLDKALKMLAARKMPPKDEPRPTEDQYNPVTTWIGAYTDKFYNEGPIDPGRVTLHRLNRAEYNNTIRDLLAVDFKPADAFPVDDAGFGFDNNGDVLSIAPVLLEKYIKAASLSLKKAVFSDPVKPAPIVQWDAATAEGDFPKTDPKAVYPSAGGSGGKALPNPVGRVFQYYGNIYAEYNFPVDGDYVFSFRGYGVQGPDGQAKAQFYIDDKDHPVGKTPIQLNFTPDNARVMPTLPTHVSAGKHYVILSFRSSTTRDQYLEALKNPPPAAVAAAPGPGRRGAPPAGSAGPAASGQVAANVPAAAPAAQPAATPADVGARGAPAAGSANAQIAAANVGARGAPAAGSANTQIAALDAGARGAPAAAAASGSAAGARGTARPQFQRPNLKSVTGNAALGVVFFSVEGPMAPTPDRMPESYHRVMVAQPSKTLTKAQAAEKIIRTFATRAYRRPATDDEVNSLMKLWTSIDDDKRTLEDEMSVVLQAVLANPNFLFRVEHDPLPTEKNNVHTLDEYELASRLSYFLWSSMPDDELFALAAKGKLRANLDAQIDRMLKDPKSEALVDNFAGQWLRLRQVENVSPDPGLYPAFNDDPQLRESMLKETQLFFSSIKDEDRPVLDFITANYSFMDGRLAKFYGIDGVTGDDFKRVTFPKDSPRGGLITQASVLTLTSYNNRTSPVQRGKWVLENLLDAAPPPPPPNVPILENEHQLTGTLRQQMEQHRANPTCAACHERMDAIGFSLENFNGIGQWRTKDATGVPIDASGSLPDGRTFNGAAQLKQILAGQKSQFYRCVADKMLTYAIGRGMEASDKRTLDNIVTDMQKHGEKFSAMVKAVAHSDAFQKRRGVQNTDLPSPANSTKISQN